MRDNTIVLGGVEVDEPEGIPFISRLAILGEIDTSDIADPAATSPGTPSANLIEMDRSYYASIEVGRRNVSLSNLKKIAGGFHITISELMRGVE